jgi:LPS-assembly protein
MLKIFLFFIFALSLYAADDKVEIYATTIESHGNIIEAHGDVVVVYKDYILSAKDARYNKESSDLELFENIRANNEGKYKLLGSYAKLNLATKQKSFQPFFMLDTASEVWLSGESGDTEYNDIAIKSGVMSGCNPNDPLWKMEFSSSSYNTESKWLNLYNARIYIYDILVLYTPYFGYSLDTTRRTGLLVPTFGISNDEGFYYEQPLYIAEQNWWDLELKPQIRTNRGGGGYAEFRFLDSAVSQGTLRGGYFKEKVDYVSKNELLYDSHYGYNFGYNNRDFVNQWFGTDLEAQTGLYIDINNMTDVDYINLSTNDTTQNVTATQVLSRINIFYNSEKNYLGLYAKYYKDLTLESNDETLQQLPTLHYHNYLGTLLDDVMLYNLDVQSNNIYRQADKKVVQTNINLPITFQTALFDDYINVYYKTQLYAQHSKFSGDALDASVVYDDGLLMRNSNAFGVSTQLTKAFDTFTHVIGFGSTFNTKGIDSRDGFYEEYEEYCLNPENQDTPACEFYNISEIDETLSFDFTQYFYNQESQEVLYHRLAQVVTYGDNSDQLGELENELNYQITPSLSYYNNMFYNYSMNSFSKIFNQLSYTKSGWQLSLSHLYKDTFLEKTDTYTPYTSYITSSASYTYDEHYRYHASLNYDYENKSKKSSEIGFMYKKRCWDFGLRYVENTRPILTTTQSDSVYDRYLYISIALKPLMRSSGSSSDFALKLPENLEGM